MTSILPYARQLKSQLQSSFAAVEFLSADRVEDVCRSVGHYFRHCFWTPNITILTFLRQVFDGNSSCRKAVAMTLAPAAVCDDGYEAMSGDPSAYSQARQRLPRAVLEMLNRKTVDEVQMKASASRLWCGRRVVIVDGSSASMPDAKELQKAYPQPVGQKPGCGFPVMRILAIFCWASGCLLEWAADSFAVSELALLRKLLDRLRAGTVVLADTFYSSYYDLALLRQRGLEGVFRLHQRRPIDFRSGQRLGENDQRVTWTKPRIMPRNISAQDWAHIPETLTVRHVRAHVDIPGFRSRKLELVTTLLDPVAYPAEKLAELYRDRWLAELNLRSLKTTLHMEVLKGQSKEMVLKELCVYQLAYNLIRLLMWRAAQSCGMDARRLSFAGTQQRILAFLPYLAASRTVAEYQRLAVRLLEHIVGDELPDRPNRIEPRAVKRRPKNHRRLTVPRHVAKTMDYFING